MMIIAVASQNRREVTGHTGRCRRFWTYQIEEGEVRSKSLLELPREQSFHESPPGAPHPLDGAEVLITGGMGPGLERRLKARGIRALVTSETDPDRAVATFLGGKLPLAAAQAHGHDDKA